VSLVDELEAAAAAAAGYGAVSAVLAAEESPGRRAYLVGFGQDDGRSWLVLDAELRPVEERARVHEVASIVALCELAVELGAELAGRGEHEGPGGLDGAGQAAAELAEVIGDPPRVASPVFLDRVGAATRRVERELGDRGSPLTGTLESYSGVVEAFVAEVDGAQRLPLR
jgi:hypothetical protein